MSKLKSKRKLLQCQICICVKQHQNLSYKPQLLSSDIYEELHVHLMGPITPAGWNCCRYALIITDSRLKCCWVEDLHEKKEAGPAFRKFVTFIENRTNQKVKRVRIDKGREFGVRKLESWWAEKSIKIEYIVTYSLKMNRIVKKTNSLIVTKARYLLFDSSLPQSFWPEAFETAVYLLNRLPSISLDYNVPLKEFLKAYHNNYQYNYTQDLSHLHIWGYKISVHIPPKK